MTEYLPVLQFDEVSRLFRRGGHESVEALSNVSFSVQRREIVAVIGPSGAGKTTLANIALGLDRPTRGLVRWGTTELHRLKGGALRRAQRGNRLITQDPFGALHPAMTVVEIVEEPLRRSGLARSSWSAIAERALERVGLDPVLYHHRFAHQLSGGQRQRVCIARATVGNPTLIVADEPTSMLDVSVRADITSLLRSLCDEQSMGILLITHDLGIARHVANRVVVLQKGTVVEYGSVDDVFSRPVAPLTKALISAAS